MTIFLKAAFVFLFQFGYILKCTTSIEAYVILIFSSSYFIYSIFKIYIALILQSSFRLNAITILSFIV